MLHNRVSTAQPLQRRVAVAAPFLRPLTCHAAAEATPEAATTSVKIDELCSGKVTKILPEMVSVTLDNNDPASLHISMISRERVDDIEEVFAVGDELKAVVVSITRRTGIKLSTKALELVPGQMKTDKQAVFASADKGLAQYLVWKNEMMDQRRQALSHLQVGSVVTGTVKMRRKDGWLVMLDGVAALVRNYDQHLERRQSVQVRSCAVLATSDSTRKMAHHCRVLITSIKQTSGLVLGTTRYEQKPDGTYQPLPRLRANSPAAGPPGSSPAAEDPSDSSPPAGPTGSSQAVEDPSGSSPVAADPFGSSPAAGDPSDSSPAAEDPSGSSSSNKRQPADIGSGLADERAFQFDPATQMRMGLDPGPSKQSVQLQGFIKSKLTRSQVQHDSGLIQARHNTQRWNENVKLELQHLTAATPAGTSLVAIQRHVAVTLATWDAVWEEYLHPKWAEQKTRLHGAQEKVLERYFKKKRWGTRKQLVVFFGNAGIGTRGGWGAKAVLQACRKVVERPNSGKPNDRVPGKVVTVDEFRTSRVSSVMNNPQPCEVELDRSKPTRLEGWKPQPGQVQKRLLRSAWSKRFEVPVRGLMWCPQLHQATPGDLGKWVDRDCNAALNMQRAGESKWRPLELCRWPHRARLLAEGREYPTLGFKKRRDQAPKALAQQPVAQ
ncbi:hypothetical protein QJQ45_012170 [Haematococcus lacustris]|nr:hypothetical protein QJQ45_012170 [Haematococcus lacustris]